jgi:ribosomal protein S12 methylthiotransferase accessory factor
MSEQQNPLAAQLETAAATLTSDAAPAEIGDNGVSILRYHGYDDGNVAEAAGRARMLRAAAKLHRLFLLPVPDAAGVVFFGGAADPAILAPGQAGAAIGSLAGAGLSPQRAFEACVGEGIEYLSQFVRAEDAIEFGLLADYRDAYDPDTGRFISAALAFCRCRSRPVDCMDCRSTGDRRRAGALPARSLLSAASLAAEFHAPAQTQYRLRGGADRRGRCVARGA